MNRDGGRELVGCLFCTVLQGCRRGGVDIIRSKKKKQK
jgi:hypothetical protein